MDARRLRLTTILAIAVFAALALLAGTQLWWTIRITARSLDVPGTVAAPALSALSLSGFALAAALAIAGPFFRLVLGVLQLLLSATLVLTTVLSIVHPAEPSQDVISRATGITGAGSVEALVRGVGYTAWPYLAILFGVLSFLAGVFLLATMRAWPRTSRKYQAVRLEAVEGDRDSVGEWDALSNGRDPTER